MAVTLDNIVAPKEYSIIYQCEGCDSEYELSKTLVKSLPIWCDICRKITYWYSEKMVHKSWDWDRIEEDI